MSEPKQQPKILLRKPKKSHRSPSDPSSSLSNGDGASGGARSVSTASSNSAPPPLGPKQPLWYRFRTALTTLLVVNVVVIGYTMFRTSSKPSETLEEAQSVENTATEEEKDEKKPKEETPTEKAQDEKKPIEEATIEKEKDEEKPMKAEIEKEKAESVHTKIMLPEPKIVLPEPSKIPQELSTQKISAEDQQELYKWLLAEKRKVKPTNKAEKAQIDAEKALLKEFLRGKGVLNV